MKFFCSLILALCLSSAPTLLATIYHVDPGGSDTGVGSQSSPFRQIRKALEVAGPGDEIRVADGQYLGFDIVEKGDINGAPLTIRATGDNAEIIVTTDRGKNNSSNIVVYQSKNVVIDGFRSFGAATAGVRMFQCWAITVRNCTLGNHGYWGIVTSHTPDVVLENNVCYASQAEHGIYVANSADNPIVRGNILHSNAGSGLRMNGDSFDAAGMGTDGVITGALIEKNIIYGNGSVGGAGININNIKQTTIRNNLLYNNYASGIALFKDAEGVDGPADIEIYHNTIDMAANARYVLRIVDASGPVIARNNIFYNRNTGKGPYSWKSSADSSLTDSDFNVFAGGMVVTNDDEATNWGYANWQATGNDQNSVVAGNPASLFENLSGPDYHLSSNSAAINAGTSLNVGVPLDIEGNARPSGVAPDAGAYERNIEPSLKPKIEIELDLDPSTPVDNGGSTDFSSIPEGEMVERVFTISNRGNSELSGIAASLSGADKADFAIITSPVTTLAPGADTRMTVRFAPTTSGAKAASLHVASNDTDENPYVINLTGRALSETDDSDNDRMNDVAEFYLAPLGFDWATDNTELVDLYYQNANLTGLYTEDQIMALRVDTPLLKRDPGNGKFTITLRLGACTDLASGSYTPFPITATNTVINGNGEVEFTFEGSGDSAFYKVEAE